ncbi:putative neuroblastoma breakpoint family member 5 [Sapajus apella]|uniref:Neuroblastoma breakpoint family member 5 n=1 Tax=Sapajus apella TaxID=9515 RepID=A0A6J3HDK9_SAPAP|nr:putative neuroblastoma breakpoint family member 5 [Sapajus apella]
MEMVEQDEVPGSPCGAPNVTIVGASCRTCSGKTTEANFPNTMENSYSQQEETKPNIRASKNRLLMSQVAYFLNYQLKTYRDQNDQNEEQKCRDSKNKLLTSQVAYYLGCRLKTEKNNKDEDEDIHVVEAEKIQESRAPRNLQESVEEEAPQESWDEGYSTSLNSSWHICLQ